MERFSHSVGTLGFEPKDFLTAISVLIAISGFLYAWRKDRKLSKRDYADKIRKAAAETVVALERWKAIALAFYQNVQPLITATDVKIVREGDAISARDYLWQGLVGLRAACLQNILNEKFELAYVNLYGYDPHIQALYSSTTFRLKTADYAAYYSLLERTQADVHEMANIKKPYESARLDNMLRRTCTGLEETLAHRTSQILDEFRSEMLRVINASDTEIVNRQLSISESLNLHQEEQPSSK